MFSFSAFAPGEGTGANAIGLKTLANKATANIGGGAVLKADQLYLMVIRLLLILKEHME